MLLHHSQLNKIMQAVDIMDGRINFLAKEDVVLNIEEIGKVSVTAGVPVIWHITVGIMKYVLT